MASKFVAPDLSNATPEMLADEMGKLSIMESQVKKLRAVYKEAYYARMGINVDEMVPDVAVIGTGDIFYATTVRSDPSRFDQAAFAADHPVEFEEYKKSKPQLTTRFSLKEGVNNPIVGDLLAQMKAELDLD